MSVPKTYRHGGNVLGGVTALRIAVAISHVRQRFVCTHSRVIYANRLPTPMYELGHLTGTYVCVGLLLLSAGGGWGECTSVSGFPTSRPCNPAAGSNRHVARVHIEGRARWRRRACHGLVIANSDKRQLRDRLVLGVPGRILTNPTESWRNTYDHTPSSFVGRRKNNCPDRPRPNESGWIRTNPNNNHK